MYRGGQAVAGIPDFLRQPRSWRLRRRGGRELSYPGARLHSYALPATARTARQIRASSPYQCRQRVRVRDECGRRGRPVTLAMLAGSPPCCPPARARTTFWYDVHVDAGPDDALPQTNTPQGVDAVGRRRRSQTQRTSVAPEPAAPMHNTASIGSELISDAVALPTSLQRFLTAA